MPLCTVNTNKRIIVSVSKNKPVFLFVYNLIIFVYSQYNKHVYNNVVSMSVCRNKTYNIVFCLKHRNTIGLE